MSHGNALPVPHIPLQLQLVFFNALCVCICACSLVHSCLTGFQLVEFALSLVDLSLLILVDITVFERCVYDLFEFLLSSFDIVCCHKRNKLCLCFGASVCVRCRACLAMSLVRKVKGVQHTYSLQTGGLFE